MKNNERSRRRRLRFWMFFERTDWAYRYCPRRIHSSWEPRWWESFLPVKWWGLFPAVVIAIPIGGPIIATETQYLYGPSVSDFTAFYDAQPARPINDGNASFSQESASSPMKTARIDVLTVIGSKCAGCHGSKNPKGKFQLGGRRFESLTRAERIKINKRISFPAGSTHRMPPPSKPPLTDAERNAIIEAVVIPSRKDRDD